MESSCQLNGWIACKRTRMMMIPGGVAVYLPSFPCIQMSTPLKPCVVGLYHPLYLYHPLLKDEETEAQRGPMSFLRSQHPCRVESGLWPD